MRVLVVEESAEQGEALRAALRLGWEALTRDLALPERRGRAEIGL